MKAIVKILLVRKRVANDRADKARERVRKNSDKRGGFVAKRRQALCEYVGNDWLSFRGENRVTGSGVPYQCEIVKRSR